MEPKEIFAKQLDRERALLEKEPDFVYNNIRPILFGAEGTEGITEKSQIIKKVFDMICLLYVEIDDQQICILTDRVWNILKLTGRKEFYDFKSMYEVALSNIKEEEIVMHPDGTDHSGVLEMHMVLSSKTMFGSSLMLSRNILRKLAKMMECESYYIAMNGFSSIMLFPICRQNIERSLGPEEIHHVAMEIVKQKKKIGLDKVTDHVFKYDINTDKITKEI